MVITDIRPGFVDTALIVGHTYPLEMSLDYVAPRLERAMLAGRRVAVIDSRWAVVTALWRLVPACLWRHIELTGW